MGRCTPSKLIGNVMQPDSGIPAMAFNFPGFVDRWLNGTWGVNLNGMSQW